jgi:anti-sigma factor RsiW
MKCENDKEQITLWINNEMTEAERNAFELHLAECAECRQELKAEQRIWNMMNEVSAPQPSTDMPVRFQAMLEEYKESQQPRSKSCFRVYRKTAPVLDIAAGYATGLYDNIDRSWFRHWIPH